MVFDGFNIKPVVDVNGAKWNHICLMVFFPPGGGKDSLLEGEGLPLDHFQMSGALEAAALSNPTLKAEMDRARQQCRLIPAQPFVTGVSYARLREHRRNTFANGMMRHPDELKTFRLMSFYRFRPVVVHGHLSREICVERMLARGRAGENTPELCGQRYDDYVRDSLETYNAIVEGSLADVFDLGDLAPTTRESRRAAVRGILAGYGVT